MLYLLYGPDTYSSSQKLRELTRAFVEKSGGHWGLIRVDLEDTPERVALLGRSGSLFSARQLLVVERSSRAPKAAADRTLELASAWAGDRNTVAIFWEGDSAAKGNAMLDRLRSLAAKTQEFPLLAKSGVLRWLKGQAAARGLSLSPAEAELLAARSGGDLWALSNELDQIQAGAAIQDRRREEEKVWDFTDVFFVGRLSAVASLARLLEAGYEAIYLIGALAGAFRTLATVRWGLVTGTLREVTGHLHPYVVKKFSAMARTVDADRLRRSYRVLLSADIELKTGRLPPPLPLIKLTLQRR